MRDDAGSAPNPFWGICTLVICKPTIRRVAQIGDWVVGTGSTRSPKGNIKDKIVYAMRVTDKMTMREYDEWAQEERPEKVPDMRSRDWRRKLGDAVYDYSEDPPKKRPGPHGEGERETDLSGRYVLLSEHFYYFGDNPRALPDCLLEIARVRRAHRSTKNAPYLEPFVQWIESLDLEPNILHGSPQLQQDTSVSGLSISRKPQRNLDEFRREAG